MASNAVSQNSTNQPGNIVTPVAQNQSAPAALTAPGAGFVSSDQAVRDQVAAMSRQAEAMSTRQAPQAPAPIQTVADLGRPAPAPGPQYTVGQASINPAELPPTTQPVIQSNSVPQQQDYARLLPQTNTTPSGAVVNPRDRIKAVVDLAKQGMTDPARLQQYLNVSQAGALPTNYTVEEIQSILTQNPNARPTQATTASNSIQQGITDLQNVLTSSQRSIIPSNTLSNLQTALTEANNGVVTSDLATNISNIIGGILNNYQTLSLPQLPDYSGEIEALQQRREELSSWINGSQDDPALLQFIAIERENAANRLAQIQDIQARSQQAYDDQIETNKVADARAQVAMAGARLTGSPVAASYLASVALQGRRALTEITTAQNRAINEAEAAYRKDNIELALKKIDLAEKRRSQYFDLLDKQVSLEQNLYQAQTDRIKLQSDLQDKYLERQRQAKADARADIEYAKKNAQESYGEFLKANLDPSVIPEEAYQDYAAANNITLNAAKAIYKGQSADLAAAKAQEKAKNAAEIDKARLSLIKAEQDVAYNLNPGEKVTYTSADGTTKTITGAFNLRDAKQYSVETPRGKEVITLDQSGKEIGRTVLGPNYVQPQYDNDLHEWRAYNPNNDQEVTVFNNGPFDEGTKVFTDGKDIVNGFTSLFGKPTQEPGGSFTHGNTMSYDYSVRANTPIQSPVSGVVVNSRNGVTQNYKRPEDGSVDFGNFVEIMDEKTGMIVRLAHFSDTQLKPGERVTAGQVVGRSGNTGLSTNPHLHLEFLTSDGKAISPHNDAIAANKPVLGGDVHGHAQAVNKQVVQEDPFTVYERDFGVTLNRKSDKDKMRALNYAEDRKKKVSGETLTDAQKLSIQKSPERESITAVKDLLDTLNEYKTQINTYGFESYGPQSAVTDRIYADLQVKYKEAARLGALTGPDLALLEQAIKPASGGLLNAAKYGLMAGGKEGVTGAIDSLDASLRRSAQRKLDSLLSQYQGSENDPYIKDLSKGIQMPTQEAQDKQPIKAKGSDGKYYMVDPSEPEYEEALRTGQFKI